MTDIEDRLKNLPVAPGVYLMKGKGSEVLYIGKAKNLRARVRSYFQKTGDTRYAVRFLASRVEDIDCIVTANEKEALLLEDTLLKQHKPRYNIRLKDSKTYVSIKITVRDSFPRILVVRQVKKDGSRYFGPYTSARAVRDAVKFIRGVFPLRVCSDAVFRNRTRPCLDYQMGLCPAPAVGLISEGAYRELVDSAIMFLEGRNRELLRLLKGRMEEAAGALDFEKAARLRDRINAIEEMLEEQKVVTHRGVDQDVFFLAREGPTVVVQTLLVRQGRLVGGNPYFFEESGLPDEEIISSFLTEFYRGERYIPDEAVLPIRIEDAGVLGEWLTEKKGRKVSIVAPLRGDKQRLLEMAESNALEALNKKRETEAGRHGVLDELKRRLRLDKPPVHIEAFDISNIGGTLAVGAMVVFRNAAPDKGSYRLYRIKGIEGPDDYAMMEQALSRRYGKEGGRGAQAAEAGLPDLILMDGGKGQLNIALKVLDTLGIKGVETAALAKERDEEEARTGRISRAKGERVYRPNVKDPILLKEGSKADLLLRRIRDEVHRFAISYHRTLRSKGISSVLDTVPGIGEKKRRALFERFNDLDGIVNASLEDLMKVPGVTEKIAVAIKNLKGPDGPGNG
ncbi:MAG: excinuclease ABC subunit UvrC [Deltaproteobacteria bacterium]|nr:excinuclease ABC subunit UvrC [Deltaproteobacteria bacterium]